MVPRKLRVSSTFAISKSRTFDVPRVLVYQCVLFSGCSYLKPESWIFLPRDHLVVSGITYHDVHLSIICVHKDLILCLWYYIFTVGEASTSHKKTSRMRSPSKFSIEDIDNKKLRRT